MAKNLNYLKDNFDKFRRWIFTRKFYGQAPQVNILVKLQKKKNGVQKEPPNSFNCSYCSALNLILSRAEENDALADDIFRKYTHISQVPNSIKEVCKLKDHFKCFIWVYFPETREAKKKTFAFAEELGVDRDTVYQRAHKMAVKYDKQALELEELHKALQREVEDEIKREYEYD